MKIIINYDLIEKIRDSKDDFRFRVLRKNFNQAIRFLPSWFLLGTIVSGQIDKGLSMATTSAAIYFGISTTTDILAEYLINNLAGDVEKERAIRDLKKLSVLLTDINVKTSFELLQKAEEDERKYSVKLDENKIPYLFQEKYILVPTYHDGEIRDTSLLQEHVIGSKEYVLSVGEPMKVRKLVFARAH